MSSAVAEALADHIYPLQRENNARRAHAMTFSCLGKLAATDRAILAQWRSHLEGLIRSDVDPPDPSSPPLVIGLAESGIIPSALCHQILRDAGIPARWICSTRRPARGVAFTESHSHAPDQTLPLPAEPPSAFWFVEDEITTGRTVRRLARRLCEITGVRRVKIFAFADLRGPEATREFDANLSGAGLRFSIHPLVRMREPAPAGGSRPAPEPLSDRPSAPRGETDPRRWHFPRLRPALGALADPPSIPFDGPLSGSLLVVGEAVDLGLALVRQNPDLAFCHVTLSPWQVDGVHIHRRLDIPGGYYLYNPHTLTPPLFILADPADSAVGRAVRQKLAEAGLSAEFLDFPEMGS